MNHNYVLHDTLILAVRPALGCQISHVVPQLSHRLPTPPLPATQAVVGLPQTDGVAVYQQFNYATSCRTTPSESIAYIDETGIDTFIYREFEPVVIEKRQTRTDDIEARALARGCPHGTSKTTIVTFMEWMHRQWQFSQILGSLLYLRYNSRFVVLYFKA